MEMRPQERKEERKRHGVCKKQKRTRKYNKNGNRYGNFDPSLKAKKTRKENSSQANSQERIILTIPEEINHTELGEINNNL